MTKTSLRGILAVALLLGFALMEPSHAIFGIFSSKDRHRVATKEEIAQHDQTAALLFAKAEADQNGGKGKKALGYYTTIVRKCYFSKYAPEATFRSAELLLASGETSDAFDYYQNLIDRYRSSARFQRAVEQQYNIAHASLTEKNEAFLGVVPRKTSRDRVIAMFQAVISNAPASIYAANSQYYIARIHEGRKDYDQAIAGFQTVVDDYPRSPKAPEAQLKIAEIYEKTARRPDNPTNLRESREAYEDFLTSFPQHSDSGDAYAQLNAIDEKTAKKSLKIAEYYRKQGNNKAAAIYYKEVLRSTNAALQLEARQGIEEIRRVEPTAVELAKIDEAETRTPEPSARLKNQRNYLGPAAPDVAAKPKPTPKPKSEPAKSPLVTSDLDPQPLVVTPEPDLPAATRDFAVDPLVPSPPPATDADILIGEDGPLIEPETDIDSLLPPVPKADDSLEE